VGIILIMDFLFWKMKKDNYISINVVIKL